MQERLNQNQYSSLAAVGSDIEKMVENAKTFNEEGSTIYEDAERIGKMFSDFARAASTMDKIQNSFAAATASSSETPKADSDRKKRRQSVNSQSSHKRTHSQLEKSESQSSGLAGSGGDATSFSGMTFQEAQDQLLTEMIEYKDER
jgi:hypothetical protein